MAQRLKPAAPVWLHLLLAAGLWSVVGLGLLLTGAHWALSSPLPHRVWLLLGAALLGLIKARLVLEPVARRAAERIAARGDGRCLGGFLSVPSWVMVALMVLGGRALRAWVIPMAWAGLLYVLVGFALLVASRVQWRALVARRRMTHPPPGR